MFQYFEKAQRNTDRVQLEVLRVVRAFFGDSVMCEDDVKSTHRGSFKLRYKYYYWQEAPYVQPGDSFDFLEAEIHCYFTG